MKNLKLNFEGFEEYLVDRNPVTFHAVDGVQYIFGFPNGYGASVIKHKGSYGYGSDTWELAVIKFGPGGRDDWDLCYDTDITDDVLGFLTDEEIRDLLKKIMEL